MTKNNFDGLNEIKNPNMKIVTVNVPESYLDAIAKLVIKKDENGDVTNGLYPSRSELIRCAVREFLMKELKMAKNMSKYNEPEFKDVFDDDNFVTVPVTDKKIEFEERPVQVEKSERNYTHICPNCDKKRFGNDMNGNCPNCNYPQHKTKEPKEAVREFKTYKILKRLEL